MSNLSCNLKEKVVLDVASGFRHVGPSSWEGSFSREGMKSSHEQEKLRWGEIKAQHQCEAAGTPGEGNWITYNGDRRGGGGCARRSLKSNLH